MTTTDHDPRTAKILDRARQLFREANGGPDCVPELYMRRAEEELLTEGAIKPGGPDTSVTVDKLNAQNDR